MWSALFLSAAGGLDDDASAKIHRNRDALARAMSSLRRLAVTGMLAPPSGVTDEVSLDISKKIVISTL